MRTTHAGALMPHSPPPPSNIVLMLHFDGPNGSTNFIDSSRSEHPMTAAGGAVISTAQSLLTSSGDFNNEPTSLVSCPNSQDFNFGAGAWTIEAFLWVRPTNNNAFLCGSYQGAAFSGFYCLVQFATPAMSFYRDDEPFTVYTVSGGALSTETWHHVAWVRDNDEIRIYQDGGMLGRLVINAAAGVRFSTDEFTVGGNNDASVTFDGFDGYVEDLRVSKGLARYTGTTSAPGSCFTVPSVPLANF